MHRQWTKWLVGLTVMAVLLMVGLTALAANTQHQLSVAPQHKGQPSTGVKHAVGNAPALGTYNMSPAMKNIVDQLRAKGLKSLTNTPKAKFKAPAYKMFAEMAERAGVKVPESVKLHPESLCPTYSGWLAGPAMASNTNGTAMVWGGGQNLYFASNSDPTHPTVVPWGDYIMRIYFQGNIAIVLGYFDTYMFDVTDPVNPSFVGWDGYGFGFGFGFTGYQMTPDGQLIVGLYYGDDLVFYDGGFNALDVVNLETIYGPTFPWTSIPLLTDMVIPDTPGTVAIITDWDNYLIHFIDLSDIVCSGARYLGFIDDDIYGTDATGQVMYQAPYLYTVYEPWWNYQPFEPFYPTPCADNAYDINIFSVPDIAVPSTFISVKDWYSNNYGNDVVAIRPGGNGRVVLGLYNGQVAIWDAQGNTLLEWGTMGKFGHDTGGFGWCASDAPNYEYFSTDMGYSATGGGITADWAGGARFFGPNPTPETGYYLTGDWTYNAVAVGSTLYVPNFATGMAIVDGTDPTYPTTIGWLPTIPSLPYIGLVSVTGTTAFVAADFDTLYTKVYAADISNPAAPTYLSTSSTAFDITAAPGYGTMVQTLAANGGICWIGTDTSVVGVDFSNPSAPAVVAAFPVTYAANGALQMTTFVHPGFPLSTFLAVAEGAGFDVFDITVPTAVPACPTPYFWVAAMASPTAGFMDQIFASGKYLIVNDTANGDVTSIGVDAQLANACGAGELLLGTTVSTLYTGGDVWPYGIAYAGTVGGSVVGAVSDGYYGLTIFNLTDPTALAYFTVPPQIVPNYSFYYNPGLVYCNGGLYYDSGYGGLNDYVLAPGFTPATVNSVTVSPSIGGFFTGSVTVSVNVTAADSAVNEVDIYFEGDTVAAVPTSIAAGTTKTVTYTWDTSKWKGTCGADFVCAQAFDDGCNESAVVCTAGTYSINLAPTISLSGYSPAVPTGGGCAPPAGTWIVCGDLSFNACATDGPCNLPNGISQMALYLDSYDHANPTANLITYINNPTCPPGWDIVFDTTTVSDGQHQLIVVATDNQGLWSTKKTPSFTVHNIGPTTTIVAPLAGNVVSGTAIPVRATCVSAGSNLPIAKVEFWLDFFSSAVLKIGTATAPDADGLFSIAWDATATGTNTPYGDHTLTAIGFDGSGACVATYVSPLVSFHLIQYTPPTVTATATPTSGNIPLSVAFAANVTNGTAPFTYAWTFGDGNTGSGQATTHTYTTAGTFTWSVTVTDGMANTATASGTITAINPVTPPTVTGVQKATNPFRLRITGSNFHPGCTVRINGVAVPVTTYKNSGLLVAKKGAALKAMVPKGVTVQISVKNNDDGGISADFPYTR